MELRRRIISSGAASLTAAVCCMQVEACRQQQPAAARRLPGALPLLACSASHAAAEDVLVAATISGIDGEHCRSSGRPRSRHALAASSHCMHCLHAETGVTCGFVAPDTMTMRCCCCCFCHCCLQRLQACQCCSWWTTAAAAQWACLCTHSWHGCWRVTTHCWQVRRPCKRSGGGKRQQHLRLISDACCRACCLLLQPAAASALSPRCGATWAARVCLRCCPAVRWRCVWRPGSGRCCWGSCRAARSCTSWVTCWLAALLRWARSSAAGSTAGCWRALAA